MGKNKLNHVGVKGHKFAQGDLPENDLAAAEPQHQHKRHADQRRQRGHEHAPGNDQLEIAGDVVAIGRVEAAHLRVFLSVGADDTHAGQIFLGLGGKRGQGGLNDSYSEWMILPK